MWDSVRVGFTAVPPDTIRSRAGNSSCVGQRDMAVRSAIGAPGAAAGGPHERPLHQPVRTQEAVHFGGSVVDLRGRHDHRILGGHWVVVRGPRRSQAEGRVDFRLWLLDSGCRQ